MKTINALILFLKKWFAALWEEASFPPLDSTCCLNLFNFTESVRSMLISYVKSSRWKRLKNRIEIFVTKDKWRMLNVENYKHKVFDANITIFYLMFHRIHFFFSFYMHSICLLSNKNVQQLEHGT